MFPEVDREQFPYDLETRSISFGLNLPPSLQSEISNYVKDVPCFADREVDKGFYLDNRNSAEDVLGEPIFVAQYFDVATSCPAIKKLLDDSLLQWVAGSFLGSMPVFVGANLWWAFPVAASEEDRNRHAHLFHRDLDDFRFPKFYFYLTDVEENDGVHILVLASHEKTPVFCFGDKWNIRRYSDSEINGLSGKNEIVEMCAPVGTGFAENTLCVLKGLAPTHRPRFLLQSQFALFDYGATDDNRSQEVLKVIA